MTSRSVVGLLLAAGLFALWCVIAINATSTSSTELLNASFDPTRELWRDLNAQFIADYQHRTGTRLTIRQSHAGSASQARAVIDGLEADVATLALWPDTEAVHRRGLIADGWEDRLPNHSLPYFSTIVFVVRKGNPKQIRDWPDLVQPGIEIITPNPRTSGNGKLSFLAAWASVVQRSGSDDDARHYLTEIYRRVPVLDTGARAATSTFAQKGIGDVHLTWENEAHLEVQESPDLEIVYPPISIRAEPYVAVVDANVDYKGTRAAAEAYMQFLYTDAAQETFARHYYRPANADVLHKHANRFPAIELVQVTDFVHDWDTALEKFFADGAIFDQVMRR
jgi:sulfate transport system substrate-binding protein